MRTDHPSPPPTFHYLHMQAGFDAAEGDPIGECHLTPAGFAHMTAALKAVAPLCLLLEGGYNLSATAVATEACLRVLLGEQVPPLPWPRQGATKQQRQRQEQQGSVQPAAQAEECCSVSPCPAALQAIAEAIQVQAMHWGCLRAAAHTLAWGGRLGITGQGAAWEGCAGSGRQGQAPGGGRDAGGCEEASCWGGGAHALAWGACGRATSLGLAWGDCQGQGGDGMGMPWGGCRGSAAQALGNTCSGHDDECWGGLQELSSGDVSGDAGLLDLSSSGWRHCGGGGCLCDCGGACQGDCSSGRACRSASTGSGSATSSALVLTAASSWDGACQGHRGRGPGLGGAAAGITSGAGDAARYKGSLLRGAKHVAASAIRKRALRSFWVRQHALLHGDAKQRQGSRRQAVHGTSRRCAAVACVCCHMPTLAALQQAGKGKKK